MAIAAWILIRSVRSKVRRAWWCTYGPALRCLLSASYLSDPVSAPLQAEDLEPESNFPSKSTRVPTTVALRVGYLVTPPRFRAERRMAAIHLPPNVLGQRNCSQLR